MKWLNCSLIKKEKKGVDRLNNPIYEDVEYRSAYCRFAPLTEKDIAMSSREITSRTAKIIVRDTFNNLEPCEAVIVNGDKYTVNDKTDVSRFVVLSAERVI